MQRFEDDDAGYLAWLDENPGGYVVNTGRSITADYVVLHRTTCGTICGTPSRGVRWTAAYVKLVGERSELVQHVVREVGTRPQPCGLCRP